MRHWRQDDIHHTIHRFLAQFWGSKSTLAFRRKLRDFRQKFCQIRGDIPLAALKPSFVQQFFQLGDRASYHLQRRHQTLHSLTKIEGFAGDAKRAQSIGFIYIIPFFRIVYSHFMHFNS
jgi:hypothetical protein